MGEARRRAGRLVRSRLPWWWWGRGGLLEELDLTVQWRDSLAEELEQAEAEIARLRSAIWGALQLMPDRPAQAEGLLRSALPDGYQPVGAGHQERLADGDG